LRRFTAHALCSCVVWPLCSASDQSTYPQSFFG